jgi:Na+-transporting NADH:ubiquinone oxidoreductase subunit NqrC
MNTDRQLDRHIDGISGATLSVRAVKKLALLALYLHKQANGGKHAP